MNVTLYSQTRKRLQEDAETQKDRSLTAAEIKFNSEFEVLKNNHERELEDLRCLLEGVNKEGVREMKRMREEIEEMRERGVEHEGVIRNQKDVSEAQRMKGEEREKEREEKEISLSEKREMELQISLQALRTELERNYTMENEEKDKEKDNALQQLVAEHNSIIAALKAEYEHNMACALESQEEDLKREARGK